MKVNKIIIKLLSSKKNLERSKGEVKNVNTINYKTHKPEIGGLFCERIFGPIKDYECHCGKYDKKIYKNIICNQCGVEIIKKRYRRKRFGHIKLAVPVVHIWYFKNLPSKISYLLNLSIKKLNNIIYYNKYIILKRSFLKNKYKKFSLLNQKEFNKINIKYIKKKSNINISIGASAILSLLKRININKLYFKIRKKALLENSVFYKRKILKRLKILKLFKTGVKRGNKLTNLIIKILPVIPPDLRPIIFLEDNKFASSDLNIFYKKIIIRNNRLKKIIKLKAPKVMIINDKRLLQESVDDLFDNSSNKNKKKKYFKSLSDLLKGKKGRFRFNLLGKRVDYSGRSVIVTNPKLKLFECKISKDIAIELYKPFIIKELLRNNKNFNLRLINKLFKKRKKIIYCYLKYIIVNYPILLNRAPTLHRLSMQAFYPQLTNKKVIELHPLVCTAFNADFDGDQMAIHLPISEKAILETKILMASTQHILNISNGDPIVVPSQDMLLGLYYLTKKNNIKKNIIFSSYKEVVVAYNNHIVNVHDNVKYYIKNNIIKTTVGRIFFNYLLPKNINYINKLLKKNILKLIIKKIFLKNTINVVINFLDNIKKIGFYYSYKGGLSFGLDNIKIPKEKYNIVENNLKYSNIINEKYNNGFISKFEKINEIINIWSNSTNKITKLIIKNIKKDNIGFNSLYMMLDSGARGSEDQLKQILGIRGLITKPQKNMNNKINIIENPITSNFLEGLSVLEYFLSTHGSRKGLADTALKTADAGYLTRRLVDCSQNVIIKHYDCKTVNGLIIHNITKNIIGLFIILGVKFNNKFLIRNNQIITKKIYKKLKKYKIKHIYVRSILKCMLKDDCICIKCYGINLSTNKLINLGESVGVIAAQSIGEPGTQLTLKTFHLGGTIKNILKKNYILSKYKGIIKYKNLDYIKKNNKLISISKLSYLYIYNNKKIIYKTKILYGYFLYKKSNEYVNIKDKIYSWDPYNYIIYSKYKGYIVYKNLIKNFSYKIIINKLTGYEDKIINKIKKKKDIPYLLLINKNKKQKINLYYGYHLLINNKKFIKKGTPIIKIPKISLNYDDITGGLSKLSELFEVKKNKNESNVAEINGIIKYGKIERNYRIIKIISKLGVQKKYNIKLYKKLLFQENDYVKFGEKITDGLINLNDLLYIKGFNYFQNALIKKLQYIYNLQGVNINNKHFEIIIKQMLKFVLIIKTGDNQLLNNTVMSKEKFLKYNKNILKKSIILNSGDSKIFKNKMLIDTYKIKFENYFLKLNNKKIVKYRKSKPSISRLIIKGISKSALKNKSFISSASFQETIKILNKFSISNKIDNLLGLKENVVIGNLIPSGTGFKE
ncbi:MAG: DNA-directed RNA polymerase subunit beta' [Candidatus Shikimatogenerans sp. AspAUS03]|uniref:DNA-directed RNA polymerase subunit beta' n=1 Tax=Candidatus Shikimatogenerans sp. AspAUS03 TaxID=3158563 RepID=A0AAU7QS59_9FLAO